MFVGVIRTKDVLLNPRAVISIRGWKGFFKLLTKAFSRRPYHFVDMVQNTQWFFDDNLSSNKKNKGGFATVFSVFSILF